MRAVEARAVEVTAVVREMMARSCILKVKCRSTLLYWRSGIVFEVVRGWYSS
jgi:hypothetical protein